LLQMLEILLYLFPLPAHVEEILLQRPQSYQQRLQRFQELLQRHRVLQNLLKIPLYPKEPPLVLKENLGL